MSENISSSVLFHFTNSLENIVNILRHGFFPHYCPEYLFNNRDYRAADADVEPPQAVPMVCFCDLPLSLVKNHLKQYGRFGIGLAKDWGKRNGVAPVFYTHEQSQTFIPLSERNWAALRGNDRLAVSQLRLVTAYMKPILGPAWRKGKVRRNVHFYNEREWRYVPHLPIDENPFLPREDYKDGPKVEKLNESFKQKYTLPILSVDIEYLIVPNDGQILKLVKVLREIYKPKEVTLVTTAIMTCNRIAKDM